ncbi:MAG: ABC transporter ATP-binding protein [Pseudomonadota bacterium]|nr:ABC transporter ATP-binding protein [Pseudomonadota bacterium]QKK06418.1 MAG: ABC transporter ATP-binding protein [Pseudomonadota bacterium]
MTKPASASPAIELRNVTRILTREVIPVTLVKDINCRIEAGEFVSVTGPSGSGKSSLMYLIGLLDKPTEGQVFIDGFDTSTANKKQLEKIRLEKIGFVFQFHFLLEEFTVLENIMLPMRKLGKLSAAAMKERAEMLLAHFGLEGAGRKKPGQLSGGERQRVAVARAMANDPLIILADEPSGNLDTKNADIVFKLFEKLVKEENKTVLTITHDPALAARAQRRIHIVDGKITTEKSSP